MGSLSTLPVALWRSCVSVWLVAHLSTHNQSLNVGRLTDLLDDDDDDSDDDDDLICKCDLVVVSLVGHFLLAALSLVYITVIYNDTLHQNNAANSSDYVGDLRCRRHRMLLVDLLSALRNI